MPCGKITSPAIVQNSIPICDACCQMEDLTFTGNVDPASSWGSSEDAGEVGEQGSALVIRQAGQGDVSVVNHCI